MSRPAQNALGRELQRHGRRIALSGRCLPSASVVSTNTELCCLPKVNHHFTTAAAIVPAPEPSTHAIAPATPQIPLYQALQQTYELLETEIGGDGTWSGRVQAAQRDLYTRRRARLGVYGDELAAPQDVVSALLVDPMAEDGATREAVLQRHVGFEGTQFEITYSQDPSRDRDRLSLPAPWLSRTGFGVVEVMSHYKRDASLSSLLQTDVPLLILDPIRLLQAPSLEPVLPFLLAHKHLKIVINGAIPASSSCRDTQDRLHRQLVEFVPSYKSRKSNIGIGFVRAEKALSAIEALSQGIGMGAEIVEDRTEAIERFQHDFLASNFGPLQEQLSAYLADVAPPVANSVPAGFQVDTATTTLDVALAYISNVIMTSSRAARAVQSSAIALRQEVERRSEHARQNSVISLGISSGVVEGSVEEELGKSEREVKTLMGERLPWRKVLFGAVDDVGEEVAAEVQKCFGRDLEERLVFEAGELALLQRSLAERADECLAELSPFRNREVSGTTQPYPFHSPILLNHLQTLALTTSKPSPSTLIAPLHHRREQLLTFSVPKLHQKAQRVVMQTYSFSAASAALSWIAAVPGDLMTWYPAFGVASFGILASVRWGQERWLKAQRGFWADWHRVGGMLKQDLQSQYRNSLNTQLLVKPLAAADGLETLVKKRIERLDSIEHRRATLQRHTQGSA